MKLYKVSMNADFGHADSASLWTSRKADIPRLRRDLIDRADDESQPDPTVEEVEFLPTVAGILEMLSRHANR